MASERVILSNGGVCNVDTSDHYPGALHVTINGGATLTPPECDALIAAIGRALGRPTPTSTPLEERIANAATDALAGFGKDTDKDDWTWANGCEAGLRAALAMVREQGATVPRAGVARVLAIHAQIAETNLGEYRDGLIDLLLSELDKVRAGIDAPAPITVTVRRHKNDFRVYASYVKNRSVVVIDEYPGSWRVLSVTGDGEECIVKLESWHADTAATLEAAGLWPVAAPGGER